VSALSNWRCDTTSDTRKQRTNTTNRKLIPYGISRRHIKESRKCDGLKVLSEAEILENAKSVWNKLINHQISSAYIQAHRIANKGSKLEETTVFLVLVEKVSTQELAKNSLRHLLVEWLEMMETILVLRESSLIDNVLSTLKRLS
jgi:hypothetical protein